MLERFPTMEGRYTVTSSQISAWYLCKRRWWFEYVCGMPSTIGAQKYFTLGSCLHAITERYIFGGPEQIVPTREAALAMTHGDPFEPGGPLFGQIPGQPMELFPEHWHKSQERDGTWLELKRPGDKHKVIKMVEHAIENGTLSFMAGQKIESMMMYPLSDRMAYRSYLDHESVEEGEVRDRKTAGSSAALYTPKRLSRRVQILSYCAHILFERRRLGLPELDLIQARHDQFLKFNLKTNYVYAEEEEGIRGISKETILDFWSRLVEDSAEMRELLDQGPHRDFESIEGPRPGSNACSKYGRDGCPFKGICNGPCKMPSTITNPSPTPTMTDAPVPTPLPKPEQMPWVPWAKHDCEVCGGTGITPELTHCLQCHGFAQERHKPYWAELSHGPEGWVLRYTAPMDSALHAGLQAAVHGQDPTAACAEVIGHRISCAKHEHVYTPTGEYPPLEHEAASIFDFSVYGDGFVPDPIPPLAERTAPPTMTTAPPPLPTPAAPAAAAPAPPAAAPAAAAPAPAAEAPAAASAPAAAPAADGPDIRAELTTALSENDWGRGLEVAVAMNAGKKSVSSKGAPPKTFVYCQGPVGLEGFKVKNGDQLALAAMQVVASANGVNTFFELDKWKRREELAHMAPVIAEHVKGYHLHFQQRSPETEALMQALSALAYARIIAG